MAFQTSDEEYVCVCVWEGKPWSTISLSFMDLVYLTGNFKSILFITQSTFAEYRLLDVLSFGDALCANAK